MNRPQAAATDRRRLSVVGLAVAVAALSLLWLRVPSYDPTAWLIWGRQIVHGELMTPGGPSWKPLPVLFTTPFALAGASTAPLLWLIVARSAGFGALMATYLVARELGGRGAALIAAVALTTSSRFAYNALRGDSEGLLVLLVMCAVLAHLRGHPRASFALAVGASLIRPEAWLLVGAQGLWLLWTRPRPATLMLVAGSGLLVVALWIVPELIGSGEALRAATRAQNPVPGTPGQAAHPFTAALASAAKVLPWPLELAAIARVLVAVRRRTATDRAVCVLAAGAAVFLLTVATLAAAGFTGNARYATAPAAVVCVLGGLGAAAAVARAGRLASRPAVWAAAALALVVFGFQARRIEPDLTLLRADERVYGAELPRIIARAGGAAAVRGCGPLGTTPFARQAVAYALRVPQRDVSTRLIRRGTVLGRRGNRLVTRSPLPLRLRTASLAIRSTCPLGGA